MATSSEDTEWIQLKRAVKAWMDKQKSKQVKPYRQFNSYVAPRALFELQIDLGAWSQSAADND